MRISDWSSDVCSSDLSSSPASAAAGQPAQGIVGPSCPNAGQQSAASCAGKQRPGHTPTNHCPGAGSRTRAPPAEIEMNAAKRTEIFRRLQAANTSPTTELEYANTFQLLIAVILSAQATDRTVNLATRTFFPDNGKPEGLLALGEAGLAHPQKQQHRTNTKKTN